jgi:hypothetical protein
MAVSSTQDFELPGHRSGACSRLVAAIVAGTFAILVNMGMLVICDLAGVPTAHGGLLKLARLATGLHAFGPIGKQLFHFAVGIVMALGYVYVLEPNLRGRSLGKGLICAVLVWIVNAAVVLPITGDGFAGARHISLLGMLLFAFAHTTFFALLATGYARLMCGRGF